jgi:hypothetical protein
MIAVDEFEVGDPAAPEPVRPGRPAADDEGLNDDDLQAEIELVADLVLAASSSDHALSAEEIDRILGVERA